MLLSLTVGKAFYFFYKYKKRMDGVEKRTGEEVVAARFIKKSHCACSLLLFIMDVSQKIELQHSKRCVYRSLEDHIKELGYITGGDLRRLQRYHTVCADLASEVTNFFEWVKSGVYVWFECIECRHEVATSLVVSISTGAWAYVGIFEVMDRIYGPNYKCARRTANWTNSAEFRFDRQRIGKGQHLQ
ncbi:hypothetical protein BDQ12DRAFT_681178 [Crucibulum laeve]|uniref:Uncharacterized protein n=1 Tax=Crucibulum laeve TaxID=68775 RepID=A0A5C3M3I4_9AGAR|nr:hypothetical protein BDQ12DRAFT_681178 [Crucibulum laeve]